MSDFSINFVQFTTKEENKKKDTSPDVTGNIEVPAEEVNALIAYLQNAERVLDWQDKEVVKIRLAWLSSLYELGEGWVAEALVDVSGLISVWYALAYAFCEVKTTLIELHTDDFGEVLAH